MTNDPHPEDLLGAYAVDACAATEVATVAEHTADCPQCAAEGTRLAEAAHWLGVLTARRPPAALRTRVLEAARAARPAREPEVGRLLDPYARQVAAFDRLLAGLEPGQWRLATAKYDNVGELVTHLTASDGLVADDLGVPARSTSEPQVRRRWRAQADALLREVASGGPRLLERQVRLVGKAPMRRPLREALVQRTFETWIHADDLRTSLRLPTEPPRPDQLAGIAGFALALLPGAIDAAGRGRAGQVRLVLTGPGGTEHLVELSALGPAAPGLPTHLPDHGPTESPRGAKEGAASEASGPALAERVPVGRAVGDSGPPEGAVAEVVVPLVRFCRLLAGRVSVLESGAEIRGDAGAATDFLEVAATLGCD
ncbi:maleylpyruvate isomerase N-terminal domain-containing protein [Phytohabitans aurantiacus]|uniref:Mycothiol-dependent maleylpyruvate isomerase metal-binding domain-containing protein n=1 Tax=Phytohabitans aurantiacus TaxID=3016789 RepID=A0ABQ5R4Z4_9ACTN|nr:maleylpyruvate isomerase N-terminal domain-containing protein [Phytohabitans aurantiacus]GLI01859.1 hypothetical protein Pa4123_71360 [Phytohabitans aurantiacus]